MSSLVKGVVFDVGYTLLDETRRWNEWAAWIGVKPEELSQSMNQVIREGVHHVEALKRLAPGFDLEAARADRARANRLDEFRLEDLYPDVEPCLIRLKAAGVKIGAAGNMPMDVERFLEQGELGLDMIGSSERWGVQKPDSRFFSCIVEAIGLPAQNLIYVGDRLDNDVRPAASAGMRAVFLRRGPWAMILGATQDVSAAYAVIDSLEELPPLVIDEPGSDGRRRLPNRTRKDSPASK